MDTERRNSWNRKVRAAVNRTHKKYRDCQLTFLCEGDVQAWLYHELIEDFSRSEKVSVEIRKGRETVSVEKKAASIPLHTNLSVKRGDKDKQYPDICLVDPDAIMIREYGRSDGGTYFGDYDFVNPAGCIGVEIKLNYVAGNGGVWREMRDMIVQDMQKLKDYRYGWFIYVDHTASIHSREDWKAFFRDAATEAGHGSAPRNLDGYYMSPQFDLPICYRHPDEQ